MKASCLRSMKTIHNFDEPILIGEKVQQPDGTVETKKYTVGKLLGRGNFSKVYEVTDLSTNQNFAAKIVNKSFIEDKGLKQNLINSIGFHRKLNHPHIVKFHQAFEDQNCIYVIMELCNQSLMDLLFQKNRLSEQEVATYLVQLVNALQYIHSQKIIHRGIKLENLLLTENMELKLAGFNLCMKLSSPHERRITVGTTQSSSQEIANKVGSSYLTDIRALGLVIYFLIVGVSSYREYEGNDFYKIIEKEGIPFPPELHISPMAKDLITSLLVPDICKDITFAKILQHPFWLSSDSPRKSTSLSSSLIKSDSHILSEHKRKPSQQLKTQSSKSDSFSIDSILTPPKRTEGHSESLRNLDLKKTKHFFTFNDSTSIEIKEKCETMEDFYQKGSHHNLSTSLSKLEMKNSSSSPKETNSPDIYVTKWIDYSSKYGMGYVLSNGSIGVIFNDLTKIVNNPGSSNFYYTQEKTKNEEEKNESYSLTHYPEKLDRKVKLYKYFQEYFETNHSSVSTVSNIATLQSNSSREYSKKSNLFVTNWMKTDNAIFFKMNTKLVQVVFRDGAVLILRPMMKDIEYISRRGERRCYNRKEIATVEDREARQCLLYVEDKLKEIWRSVNITGL